MKEDPTLQLKQYSHSRKRLIQMLIEEKVDFNIICPPTDNKEFESIPVHKEPAVIIYPKHHWLNEKDVVSLHELDNEDFVGVNLGYGARDSVEIMYKEHNFTPSLCHRNSRYCYGQTICQPRLRDCGRS